MSMITFFGVIVIIGIVAVIIKSRFASDDHSPDVFPYDKEPSLFSPAERSFLGVLDQALGQQYRIMGKVRLADVIRVKSVSNRRAWQNAFNRIQSKHVDFAVCDPTTLSVKFVIELDDASHNQTKRQDRDDFVNKALQAAGILVYHFAAKRTYSLQEIQKALLASKPIGIKNPSGSQEIKAESSGRLTS